MKFRYGTISPVCALMLSSMACMAMAQSASSAPLKPAIQTNSPSPPTRRELRRDKTLEESLGYVNQAIAVIEQDHEDDAGSSAAYSARAQIYVLLGDWSQASDDLTKAEQFERDAIAKARPNDGVWIKRQYVSALKYMLGFQSQILVTLGDQKAADAKTAEAARL